jgi:hypothetical protein
LGMFVLSRCFHTGDSELMPLGSMQQSISRAFLQATPARVPAPRFQRHTKNPEMTKCPCALPVTVHIDSVATGTPYETASRSQSNTSTTITTTHQHSYHYANVDLSDSRINPEPTITTNPRLLGTRRAEIASDIHAAHCSFSFSAQLQHIIFFLSTLQ